MNNMITPCFIDVLLWIYTRGENHPNEDAPAVQEIINYLREHYLIEASDRENVNHKISDKGMIYVQAIMEAVNDVPLPYYTCEQKRKENEYI